VGINVNLPKSVLNNIDQPAIDVVSAGNGKINKSELLGTILRHFVDVLSSFDKDGFLGVRDEWISYHAYQNQSVQMLLPDGRNVVGTVTGIADDGILLVKTALGLQRFSAGEISLRALSHEM